MRSFNVCLLMLLIFKRYKTLIPITILNKVLGGSSLRPQKFDYQKDLNYSALCRMNGEDEGERKLEQFQCSGTF